MNKISNNNFIHNYKTSFNGKSEDKSSMEDNIKNGINKLVARAEREVAEYGDFAPVVEKLSSCTEGLKIGEPSLKIVYANYQKDKTFKRLELDVPSASGKSTATVVMELANKDNILKALSEDGFTDRIKENIKSAAESLSDKEFA